MMMSIGTVMCWVAWLFVIFNISPDQAGLLGFSFFYTTLFLGIVGLFSVIGLMMKKKKQDQEEIIFRQVKRTFKQGILFAIFSTIILLLLQFQMLFWWNGIILITIYILVEGAIISGRKYNNQDYV